MRTERFLCVTTECVCLAVARIDPSYVVARTHKAVVMFVQRLLKRNGLSLGRVTHRGQKPRCDAKVCASCLALVPFDDV